MRKAVLYGLALVCVCVLFALSGASAQRTINGDGGGGTGTPPVSVAVANFPQVQPVQVDKTITVTGSVAVTNLPAVQQVAGSVRLDNFPTTQPVSGSVAVSNLPVNEDGDLRIAQSADLALVVPIYYCQLTGSPLPGSRFQLNHGINFQPIGLAGISTFISLNDDPESTGTTSDCTRLAEAIATTGVEMGCVPGSVIQISPTNIQLRMACPGERNEVVRVISALSARIFEIHPHATP